MIKVSTKKEKKETAKHSESKEDNALTINSILSDKELKEYKQTIKAALKLLGKKNIGIIAHGPSFPSLTSEDTGIGSPYSNGALEFLSFLDTLGFNCLQLGPSGKTKKDNPSPYISTIFSVNPLFTDLKKLTGSDWLNLLSKETYKSIVKNNPNKDMAFVAYDYIYSEHEKALRECWKNFKHKLKHKNTLDDKELKQLKKLNSKLKEFKETHKYWLDNDALYESILKLNDNKEWHCWKKQDKDLPMDLKSKDEKIRKKAEKKINQLLEMPEITEEMDFYKFCQFITNEQIILANKATTVKYIADIQVTYSDRDWWTYQDLFLDNIWLGTPPDYFAENGQAWGFPVLNPDKLYNIKTKYQKELGDVGKLIKTRFDKMFEDNPGGVRIDHIIGLIDPWVYPKTARSARPEDGGRRLYSSPENHDYSKWAKISVNDLNLDVPPDSAHRVEESSLDNTKINDYAEIIDLITECAKNKNVPIQNIICEDLGCLTIPVLAVLVGRDLSGIRVTQFVDPSDPEHFYRAINVLSKHWITTGTHDNATLIEWSKCLRKDKSIKQHTKQLAADTYPANSANKDFESAESLEKAIIDDKTNNMFVKYKLAEMFLSPAENVLLMFTDFLGLEERYNIPGVTDPKLEAKNWRIRIPNNYQEIYFKNLASNRGLNIPESLKIAIETKEEKIISENIELLEKLEYYSNKFSQKSPVDL